MAESEQDPKVIDGAVERKRPLQPGGIIAAEQGGMLPGIAGICMYFLLLSMINSYAALTGVYGGARVKYSVLAVCTFMLIGVLGLLRLRRWGWALVVGGSLAMSTGFFFGFLKAHDARYLVQGFLSMCFFLYLVRTEVRERLRS